MARIAASLVSALLVVVVADGASMTIVAVWVARLSVRLAGTAATCATKGTPDRGTLRRAHTRVEE